MTATDEPVYKHNQPLASGMPLGGLGTGSVEIGGDGKFHNWEIFNNYQWSGNRDEVPPEMWPEDAFFALRLKQPDRPPRVRMLFHQEEQTRTVAPSHDQAFLYNYPFLWNIPRITYTGRFPFAELRYEDDELPVELDMCAFSPFIPHNERDSALPLAFFVFTVRNTGEEPCDASLMFSMRNCTGYDLEEVTLRHRLVRTGAGEHVVMTAEGVDSGHRTAGSTAVGVLGNGISRMPAWTAGRGLKGFEYTNEPACSQLYYPFRDDGELSGSEETWHRTIRRREQEAPAGSLRSPEQKVGWCWRGALCRKVHLEPGGEKDVVFLLSWFYPNHYHYRYGECRLGHMYENWFSGAEEVARYGEENFGRLREESRAFCDEFYQGSLEPWLAASLNARLTTIPKSFWWTRDGDMAVWEGQSCCQILPAARTIWSSFLPLMFFPETYTDMVRRMAEFPVDGDSEAQEAVSPMLAARYRRRRERQRKKRHRFGGWYEKRFKQYGYSEEDFRHSRGRRRRVRSALRGGATEVLRDYLWTGDADYARDLWPIVRDAVEARIEGDENGDGLPDGAISFVTYDHWFLPATNCYKCSLWLGELQAAAELARILGDEEAAERFSDVLQTGRQSFEELLWNGDYYDLCWDPKQQTTDPGCMADQVSGHLYARICGLGPVHDEERARSALRAVHRENLLPEEGLLNGVDPEGREDWRYFCRYSERGDDESRGGQWPTPWTGTEYYVAAVMAAEGLDAEALDVARNVYRRHIRAGMVYNHIECGEHYFRPLAAWAMLPALQGLVYDAAQGNLKFAPRTTPDDFDSVFVLPGAWGRLRQARSAGSQVDAVSVVSGGLALRTVVLQLPDGESTAEVAASVDGGEVQCTGSPADGAVKVELADQVTLGEGQSLEVTVELA